MDPWRSDPPESCSSTLSRSARTSPTLMVFAWIRNLTGDLKLESLGKPSRCFLSDMSLLPLLCERRAVGGRERGGVGLLQER